MRWEVEKGRLRFFAKAIGETRPEFIDEDAAKAAGHQSLLAPPTILFSGPLDHDDVPKLLQMLGIDMNNILHGEQSRSEEHTSELQSLMRISYAVFCLKKNNKTI